MNLPDLATTQNKLVPIATTATSQGCFSSAFLCACLLEDDPARFALIERDDPFLGRESIDSISVEAFAKTAGWNVPKDWRERAKYLVEHDQIHRGIDDVKFLTLAKLEDCLRVFTPEFDLESDQDTADFCRAVYPVVSSLKIEFQESVSQEGRAFQDRDASTVGDWFYIWQDRNGAAAFGSAMLRNRPTGYSGSEDAGMSALYHLRQWFARLFVELHPAKREIERICRIIDQGLCPMTEGDSVAYAFAKPVRRILLDAKRKMAPIREKDQPLLEDVAATEEVLKEVVSKVSNPDVPHTANDLFPYRMAEDFFDQLIRIFSGRTRPLALCPHFDLPHFGTVDFDADTNISNPSFYHWKDQHKAVAVEARPPAPVEPKAAQTKPDPKPTPSPNIEPVPPTLTVVELADFIQHFTNGAGENNFPTRNALDTFTEGVVGEAVCYGGAGRGKCLAHYIRQHQQTEPETVFRLCKALLELDLKRNPIKADSTGPDPFDSFPDWQREANQLRQTLLNNIHAAESRAVEQAKKNAEDKIRAAEEEERRERKYQEQLKAGTLPRWMVRSEDRDKLPKTPAPATPSAPAPWDIPSPADTPPAPATPPLPGSWETSHPAPAPATTPAPAPAMPSVIPGSSRDNPLFISVVQSAPIDIHTTDKKPPTKAVADDCEVPQEEVAAFFNVDVRTVRNWDNGKTTPPLGYSKEKRRTRAGWEIFKQYAQRDASVAENLKAAGSGAHVNAGNTMRGKKGGKRLVIDNTVPNSPDDELD